MKLEAVNSENPEEICVATITKVKDSYLWLQLESKLSFRGEKDLFNLICHSTGHICRRILPECHKQYIANYFPSGSVLK